MRTIRPQSASMVVLLVGTGLAACATNPPSPPETAPSAATSTGEPAQSARAPAYPPRVRSSAPESITVNCTGFKANGSATFDKRCKADADCVPAGILATCCAVEVKFVGIAAKDQERFQACTECIMGCPSGSKATAEDGSPISGNARAACESGVCVAH